MHGAIAAGNRVTAEAGARVLVEGGHAVDACIAAAFAAAVAEGPLTGPIGGGFLLVWVDGEATLLDCFFAVPARPLGDL
jgi:gamma-glutamyltranspeptidase/glutathione hydrolase